MSTLAHLALAASALCVSAIAVELAHPETPASGAVLEVQLGPVILALAAPDAPMRLIADRDCLHQGCPVLDIRTRLSAAPKPAPEQAGRVQHFSAATLQRERLARQSADKVLGE